ncbi:MAG: ornithine cyclodeaminase family protein [Chloroflexota bacterium]
MSTLLLTRSQVESLLDIREVIEAVQDAFVALAEGRAAMPPKAYVVLEKGDFRAIPSVLPGAVGLKWVNVHTENKCRGLPTVMAVMIYNDPQTGYPLAVLDATSITAYRTGAASAVASKYLARPESKSLGIIGAGSQAYTQIEAHMELFKIEVINIFDLSPAAVEVLIRNLPQYPLKSCSLEDAAASDIVCTLTTARAPFLGKEMIKPGTHINAVGADAKGKQELELPLLKDAVVVVDDIVQAEKAGEINMPVSRGEYSPKEVYATLGEVITGRKRGRVDDKSITVFDSTGVAIEDLAVAKLIYEKAQKIGGYKSIDFIEG